MPSRALAVPAPTCAIVALVLLVVVSLSAPLNKSLTFLEAVVENERVIFGNFGFCIADTCSHPSIGYKLEGLSGTILSSEYTAALPDSLTHMLVLNPIGAVISFVAALLGVVAIFSSAPAAVIMGAIVSVLATVTTGASFVLIMILFPLARHRFKDAGATDVSLGSANWLVLGALLALIVSTIFSLCGARRRARQSKYDELEML